MRSQHFFTYERNLTSINITPFHFRFLMHFTDSKFEGNLSLTINYLLKKYLAYLYKISLAPSKRTLTTTYQPRTKEYIIRKISVQPTYWEETQQSKVLFRIFSKFYSSYHDRLGNARRGNSSYPYILSA